LLHAKQFQPRTRSKLLAGLTAALIVLGLTGVAQSAMAQPLRTDALAPMAISGVVLTDTGAVITGHDLKLNLLMKDQSFPVWTTRTSTTTDGTGHFSLWVPAAGTYRVQVIDQSPKGAFAAQYWSKSPTLDGATDVTLAAGESRPGIDFRLAPGATITGKVTQRTSTGNIGNIFADRYVNVDIYEKNTREEWKKRESVGASPSGSGEYVVSGLPAGTYKVGFSDYFTGGSAYEAQYWSNKDSLDKAQIIELASGGAKNSVDATLQLKAPQPVPRIQGADRYATSVELSKAGYPFTANVVYIATGTNYPDALAAAPAAAKEGGPLLLTLPTDLPGSIVTELKRLAPKKVVVVGGTYAVSDAVLKKIKDLVPNTIRLSGADRFETARQVVANAFPKGTASSAYVATGFNFPDALSASAAAGAHGVPVVLVNGNAPTADSGTTSLLSSLGVKTVTVVGGTSAVTGGVEASLKGTAAVNRVSGSDRFATSVAINTDAFKSAGTAYFATGFQFPDALAGAALAGAKRSPLYVVQPDCVPAMVVKSLGDLGVQNVVPIGGTSALSGNVASLKACS
jgi:putative cell wall-binding protein